MQAANESHDSPFVGAPAPWHCKGQCFCLFGYVKVEAYPPPVAFNTFEGASPFADHEVSGAYRGGFVSIMVVRYSESPVGELYLRVWTMVLT